MPPAAILPALPAASTTLQVVQTPPFPEVVAIVPKLTNPVSVEATGERSLVIMIGRPVVFLWISDRIIDQKVWVR